MADLVRDRFIRKILEEEGSRMLSRQTARIQSSLGSRSGTLLNSRNVSVSGGSGSFDGQLTLTHPVYERFLDMRRYSNGARHKRRPIHNKVVMSAFNRIAWRLMYEFTDATRESIRREVSEQ